ncbi:MAG: ABC transporter ATP-binding protein [Candidatus Bathyarchaeota archaeon]|nr:ABC transporter ATP-binding protein [Candidatus Bathyarchaeota archaeon]
MTLLELNNVSSGYGKMIVLEKIDMHVDSGEIVSLLGPNGAGKTTLLNTIFGLADVFEGEIKFNGVNIRGRSPDRIAAMGIGYSPQQQNIFPNFTVEENLMLGAYLRKDREIKKDMEEIFEIFPEIERRRRNLAKTLSGGERQMLAVARALMLKPKLLLCDEPTAGLAPKAASLLAKKIREIRERGTTIIMVEQNAKIALSISDRTYVLAGGRIVAHDSSANLLMKKSFEQLYFK